MTTTPLRFQFVDARGYLTPQAVRTLRDIGDSDAVTNRVELYHGRPSVSEVVAVAAVSPTVRQIDQASAINTTGAAVTLSAWLAPSADSSNDGNAIYIGFSVAANSTETLAALVGVVIPPGSSLRLAASADSALTVRLDGTEL